MATAKTTARIMHYLGKIGGRLVVIHACSSHLNTLMDCLYSSSQPEAYFTAPKNPWHKQSLTKLVCNFLAQKYMFMSFSGSVWLIEGGYRTSLRIGALKLLMKEMQGLELVLV